jgi:Mu-like prophage I protein
MSLSQAERERWGREINRLNAQGWAEDKRRRTLAIQAANPGMSFERAWDQAEREQQNPAPEPTSIGEAAKLVHAQHPTWSFQESWDHAEAVYPALVRSSTLNPLHPDPRITQEMGKITKLGGTSKTATVADHLGRLAKIRKLMADHPGMDFDSAFTDICRQENEAKKEATTARFEGSYLVTAQLATQFDGLPTTIQYMPAGRSTITPNVNGKPKEITVNVTPTTAAALQGDLARLLSGNVRPFVDFDHAGGKAAALPKRFFWKDGEGVMLELDWTGAGKNAIGGRDYSYLSPTFMLSNDGDAINLPSTGAIASLVNNPAFRTIRRISAGAC